MKAYFRYSEEVAILTISLFVAGYCVGPLFWGPVSESYGRRPVFVISFIFYTGFQVGCALSRNTGSILVFRFLSGCFASAPLTNSGALLADIWEIDHRGQALALFALMPFAGPSIGPIVGGFIETGGAVSVTSLKSETADILFSFPLSLGVGHSGSQPCSPGCVSPLSSSEFQRPTLLNSCWRRRRR